MSNYRLSYLPQANAPFNIIVNKLKENNINYNLIEVSADELNPLQGVTFSDKVNNVTLDDDSPIFVDSDMNIIDGHHRYVKAIQEDKLLKAVQILLGERDACRILNKIQDIYEYENSLTLENNNDNEANIDMNNGNSFLSSIDGYNDEIQQESPNFNNQVITAYRDKPINEKSVVGNFFILTPINGYYKYEIEFDNLLDLESLGVMLRDGQEPTDTLAKLWFPYINFEELSKKYNVPVLNIKNKAIAEKAISIGYDGIKYNDKILQGLN